MLTRVRGAWLVMYTGECYPPAGALPGRKGSELSGKVIDKKTNSNRSDIHHIFFRSKAFQLNFFSTVCPGSSGPSYSIESKYFIQLSSCDLKLFWSVNEKKSTWSIVIVNKWCKPHFLMQIYWIFFLEGHYFLDIQYLQSRVFLFRFVMAYT